MTAWTEADQAELDVLLWELVDGVFTHRERCLHCFDGGVLRCPHVGEAIDAVLGWHHRRQLLTRAEQLRLDRHKLLEAAA